MRRESQAKSRVAKQKAPVPACKPIEGYGLLVSQSVPRHQENHAHEEDEICGKVVSFEPTAFKTSKSDELKDVFEAKIYADQDKKTAGKSTEPKLDPGHSVEKDSGKPGTVGHDEGKTDDRSGGTNPVEKR